MTNNIQKFPITNLGYNFIPSNAIPKGKDEYYLRNLQNRSGINYRKLTALEIELLVRNRNTSDDWNNILVSDAFNPELVRNCKFHGLVRIGKLEPYCLSFSDLKTPVGLYNSTIISCDFGDNVVVENVNYLSHYILGNEVILTNINEMVTTNHAKFGNGIVKEGEAETVRIWMEVCNENTGRKILPFVGMLPGDAYLWSKFRDDEKLQQQFIRMTETQFKTVRGYYGKVGDRTVIKNSSIIKDVWIGKDAYIKGANKLKNLTIESGEEGKTQIGEGVEMVNGVISFGCRIFYGAKAVRFVMASHSQLKYGARLINAYLGNNATISCCEVLNSLIYPFHEQHHNNSFLCASLVMGQSNIAAGATIGSNHNSRGADGEIIAGRGFWPGLCVSLKHNSKFASYTILAKEDYANELNITLPFSLVSIDVAKNNLVIMPCYWFMFNMYALARNSWKYSDRDKRREKFQIIETNYLAPDTINEMALAIEQLQLLAGENWYKAKKQTCNKEQAIQTGKWLFENEEASVYELIVEGGVFENSKRKTIITKASQAYKLYYELVQYYVALRLVEFITNAKVKRWQLLQAQLPSLAQNVTWKNIGGQLMPESQVQKFVVDLKKNKYKTWEDVHKQYKVFGELYSNQKLQHALSIYKKILGVDIKKSDKTVIKQLLQQAIATQTWMVENSYQSRAKDYSSSFRKMVYDTQEEMDAVIGRLQDNSFIKEEKERLNAFSINVNEIIKKL